MVDLGWKLVIGGRSLQRGRPKFIVGSFGVPSGDVIAGFTGGTLNPELFSKKLGRLKRVRSSRPFSSY